MRDIEKHMHFKDRYNFETAIGFDWLGMREIPDTRYLPAPAWTENKDSSADKKSSSAKK